MQGGTEARKIPELLDFAERNLAVESPRFAQSDRAGKQDRSRSVRGSKEVGVPLIMNNKLFMGRINKQLSVSPT